MRISDLILEVITGLMVTVVGYVIVSYFMTSVGSAMSVTFPSYFTSLGLGIVFIIVFFAIVIYVITHATGGERPGLPGKK